jgi:hypothetical protein
VSTSQADVILSLPIITYIKVDSLLARFTPFREEVGKKSLSSTRTPSEGNSLSKVSIALGLESREDLKELARVPKRIEFRLRPWLM